MKLLAGLVLATSLISTARADAPLTLTSSRSCDGLRDLMVDSLVYQAVQGGYYGYGYGYGGYYPAYGGAERPQAIPSAAAGAAPGAAPVQQAAPAPAPGPSHYTTTNVHEQGVDEADMVKTDGRFVYTLRNNELVIAKTWPVEKTDVVARVTFKTIYPQQLYLHGDELIVQGSPTENLDGWPQGRTRVLVIDARDRTAPRITKILDVEGWSASSRLVGDDLYLVQSTYGQLPARLQTLVQTEAQKLRRADQQSLRPWEIQARLAATLRHDLYSSITRADVDSMLPRLRTGGSDVHMSCDQLYLPPNTTQLAFTTLDKISLTDSTVEMVGAMVSGGTVYASTNALYLAAPYYTWNAAGVADYGTQVHEFSLGDHPRYVASGKVDGQILNEFSLSEYNGDLRIATTDWQWNGQQGGNQLFVLRPFGHELRTIGALRGLAKGERIYAGRMIGDKGYLVTFRQTDPLFTLDLRDPMHPRVAGELKINGFSNYIHPIGDDMLLTIGQDADAAGHVKGLHLQVFDVSDPENPARRFHETLAGQGSYSYSAAQYDPHAFTWDPVTGTLALPMQKYEGGVSSSELALFHLDLHRGFHRLGSIDHTSLAHAMADANCKTGNQPYWCNITNQAQFNMPIERSIIVDKYVLSISQAGLAIHTLAGLRQKAALTWARVDQQVAIAR